MKNKLTYMIGLVVLIAIALSVWNTSTKQSNVIRIGFVGPFTGNAASFGDFMERGLAIAKSELTAEQLAHIQIIKEDDMCSGKNGVSVAQKLISVDHVNYVIGPLCNESSIATEKLFEDNKVISISIGLPSNTIANMGPYHFSFSPEIEYLAKTVSSEILKRKLNHVGIIHIISTFEDENYQNFKKYFLQDGGTIVADEGVIKDSVDFKAAVLKIKQAKPDSLMIIARSGDLNNILKELNVQGLLGLPKFGIHAAETPILLQVKDLADGLIYPYPADKNGNGITKRYTEAYTQSYGSTPDLSSVNVYNAFNILVSAIDKCGYENKKCVQEKLAGLKDYHGASGDFSVDSRGVGTYKEIMLKTLKDGVFQKLEE